MLFSLVFRPEFVIFSGIGTAKVELGVKVEQRHRNVNTTQPTTLDPRNSTSDTVGFSNNPRRSAT